MAEARAAGEAGDGAGTPELRRDLDDYLGFARGHGETTDTRQWVADLEDMLRVAWDIMTSEQRAAFREHADVLSIADAAGEAPSQP
jgi:hypothetical protein